jgi:hypothetical protein
LNNINKLQNDKAEYKKALGDVIGEVVKEYEL